MGTFAGARRVDSPWPEALADLLAKSAANTTIAADKA
jgi:hypothetical protein